MIDEGRRSADFIRECHTVSQDVLVDLFVKCISLSCSLSIRLPHLKKIQ